MIISKDNYKSIVRTVETEYLQGPRAPILKMPVYILVPYVTKGPQAKFPGNKYADGLDQKATKQIFLRPP